MKHLITITALVFMACLSYADPATNDRDRTPAPPDLSTAEPWRVAEDPGECYRLGPPDCAEGTKCCYIGSWGICCPPHQGCVECFEERAALVKDPIVQVFKTTLDHYAQCTPTSL